jgi:hypothetical protein
MTAASLNLIQGQVVQIESLPSYGPVIGNVICISWTEDNGNGTTPCISAVHYSQVTVL